MRSPDRFLDRFAMKHPKLGIPRLMLYIAIANVAIYFIDLFAGGGYTLTAALAFDRAAIFRGEVWRLITFVFIPQSGDLVFRGSGVFFVVISAYFDYWIGSLLEREWGTTKFTLFYLTGVFLNILFGLVMGTASMYYVNLSLFFVFATLYPDLQVMLFFILPVKVKWLAWIDAALFAWSVLQSILALDLVGALLPVVAILNYLLFFWSDILGYLRRNRQRAQHQRSQAAVNFRAAQKKAKETKGYLHKCAVCGRTDTDYPDLEFRYCSKCDGYYCYCMDHINNHVHVKED